MSQVAKVIARDRKRPAPQCYAFVCTLHLTLPPNWHRSGCREPHSFQQQQSVVLCVSGNRSTLCWEHDTEVRGDIRG